MSKMEELEKRVSDLEAVLRCQQDILKTCLTVQKHNCAGMCCRVSSVGGGGYYGLGGSGGGTGCRNKTRKQVNANE